MSGTGKSDEEIAREAAKRIERQILDGGWSEEGFEATVLSALCEARQRDESRSFSNETPESTQSQSREEIIKPKSIPMG